MSGGNSQRYEAYTEGGVLSSDPVHLVVLLYEGAIQALDDARVCLNAGDQAGRARHVAKVIKIVNELLLSLRDEEGGEISQNLRRLYTYIQGQLLQRNPQKNLAVLSEVRSLLSTLVDGWRTISREKIEEPIRDREQDFPEGFYHSDNERYGGYLVETDDCRLVASF